jgi:hypothetical protein
MSVLNVNMPERDLDPEELDLEQEEEDAFGRSLFVLSFESSQVKEKLVDRYKCT